MLEKTNTPSSAVAQEPAVVIRTRKGVEILVDADVAEWLDGRAVWLSGTGYPRIWQDGKRQPLHRLVMDAPKGVPVDHINGDILNCTRANLRLCSNAENNRNSRMRKDNSSGRKGVCWDRQKGKWRAAIKLDGKQKHLGLFTCLEAAAAAYDKAALELHGDFARTNAELVG